MTVDRRVSGVELARGRVARSHRVDGVRTDRFRPRHASVRGSQPPGRRARVSHGPSENRAGPGPSVVRVQ